MSWRKTTSTPVFTGITQNAHGFAVGKWVYLVGSVYTLTNANTTASTDSVGVVSSVPTANTFNIVTE